MMPIHDKIQVNKDIAVATNENKLRSPFGDMWKHIRDSLSPLT